MEAVALFDFAATNDDELPFKKGSVLKILEEPDEHWFKAEQSGRNGLVPANYVKIRNRPVLRPINSKGHLRTRKAKKEGETSWYKKDMTRDEAEKELIKKQDGEFFIRDSESTPGDFSLSVKFSNSVQHYKILRDGAGKYFLWIVKFNSINDLINFHRTSSVSRSEEVYLRDTDTVNETTQRFAQAMYSYTTDDPEEMSFNRGDTMLLLDTSDEGWWKAENVNTKKSGLIPATYVKLCS